MDRVGLLSQRRVIGLSAEVIGNLVAELGPVWQARREARLSARAWQRALGAGAKYRLVFVDRLWATLVHLRQVTTHDVLAAWFEVDGSTITRAIGETRPLLVERGCRIGQGQRLSTLAEIIDHLGASGQDAILDATAIRVRRPAAGRIDRDWFTWGKSKWNAVKALVFTGREGRMLFCGAVRPGSCADITHARQSGLVDLLRHGPRVSILADVSCQGLRLPHRWVDHHSATPEVPEEPAILVRAVLHPATESPCQQANPGRTRHRTPETGKPWPATTVAENSSTTPSAPSRPHNPLAAGSSPARPTRLISNRNHRRDHA
ncbi:transposase [Saccharomonospora viridis]|uniref:transposase n=1 Tax=Saccharomonospora viridis TaxID=1852 RepID=UPI0024A87B62|nr:transposase [Saccharomonospora viridis]